LRLTENFELKEFACKGGSQVPDKYLATVQKLADNLQVLRDEINKERKTPKAIKINSAYRNASYNAKVGGKSNSQHLYAKAADIKISGVKPKEIAKTIEKLIKAGKMREGGIGIYDTFVHYDIRGTKARWDLSTKELNKE
jgi:uncharacterized protein YcbK (DUF882 family)